MAATYYSKPIVEHREFPIFKILFTILGIVIVGLIGVNYFLVDQPFRAALAKTSFSNIQAHAHLGAFAQPNTMLIHIVPNPALTDDNFADFLTALAQSAPRTVIAGKSITTLGLTSKWLSQYVITSDDWDGFADMSGYSLEEKKKYVLEHLEQADGSPIYVVKPKPEARRPVGEPERGLGRACAAISTATAPKLAARRSARARCLAFPIITTGLAG